MALDAPALRLHMHPLSSFCWKVLVALYEAGIPFEPVLVNGLPRGDAGFVALWPLAKMPLLQDGERVVPESSIIIEDLTARHGAGLIPADPLAAVEVRLWDRVFDLHVHAAMQTFVSDRLRPEADRDPVGVAQAGATLDTAYALLEARMADRTWAAGNGFSMADCAAFPALFYAEAVRPYRLEHPALAAYFERLLERPSVQRVLREAQPWLGYFPFADALEPRFKPATSVE